MRPPQPVLTNYSWQNKLPSLPVRTDTSFDKRYRLTDWTTQAWHAVEQALNAHWWCGWAERGRLIGAANRQAPGHAVPLSSTRKRFGHMTTANKNRPWLSTKRLYQCNDSLGHSMAVTHPNHVLSDKIADWRYYAYSIIITSSIVNTGISV